jgi:hypothetical protein
LAARPIVFLQEAVHVLKKKTFFFFKGLENEAATNFGYLCLKIFDVLHLSSRFT